MMRTALALMLLLVAVGGVASAQAQPPVVVNCSSVNDAYNECPKPYRGQYVLHQKFSNAGCAQGHGWGETDNVVWVDRGCRASFRMLDEPPLPDRRPGYGSNRPPDYGSQRPPDYGNQRPPGYGHDDGRPPAYDDRQHRQIECESRRERYTSCDWPREWRRPRLEQQLSNSSCIEGRSWGYSRRDRKIWVDHGCRAVFSER